MLIVSNIARIILCRSSIHVVSLMHTILDNQYISNLSAPSASTKPQESTTVTFIAIAGAPIGCPVSCHTPIADSISM